MLSDDVVDPDSVMAIKPGDSGVVIGYQVDEFTCTWSAEWFVARSHIYPGFTGKVSSLTHFPLEPRCEDYAFLDQAVADFEQGLDSILTDSLETPDLDTSLQESDAVTSLVSSGFLHSVSTISDNSKPQLAPSIRTHKLWCQARALLTPVSLATKMSASKLIHYFSSHPAAFGFRASTPPDNISLNLSNRKVDQSLSDFQTGLGATAHATLDTEQLICRLQVALVDTLSSLPEAEGDVIPVSKVRALLLQIHGILDKAVSKWVGNSAHILAHLAWKTATLLALVTAKRCSDLTLLCVDNQHLFLQHHAAIFVPLSGGKTDHPGHLPPQIRIESHSNVNLCPVFYLKAYLRRTESFRKKPDGS